MDSLDAMFEHELEDMYDAEHALLDALDDLMTQTENDQLKEAFEEHHRETEGHVERLEQVFDELGMEAEREECEGIQGLIKEHEEFVGMDPDQALLDWHSKMSAEKTEHYEIAAYGNLTYLADRLGMDEVADLLGQNLDEEKEALEKLKDMSDDLAAMPVEG